MADFHAREPYRACPLCGGLDFPEIKAASCGTHPLYQPPLPDAMHWRQCRRCNHIFTDGYFTEAANAILFSRTLPHQALGFALEEQRQIAGRIVAQVAAHTPPPGRWLDVGFGNGALLFAAMEWGYHPVGLDLRHENVAKLASIGIEALCEDLTRLDHPGRYAVISMADVIEHMPYPTDAIAAANRLLAPKGAVLISMPNSESVAWDVLTAQNANPYWGEIEHFHNFSRSRLCALLAEFGFRAVHFAISERYRLGMEIVAMRQDEAG